MAVETRRNMTNDTGTLIDMAYDALEGADF